MRNIILHYVLPFVAPFVVYAIWLAWARRKARTSGAGAAPEWGDAPWTWLIISGLGLVIVGLVALALNLGDPAGSVRVGVDY